MKKLALIIGLLLGYHATRRANVPELVADWLWERKAPAMERACFAQMGTEPLGELWDACQEFTGGNHD